MICRALLLGVFGTIPLYHYTTAQSPRLSPSYNYDFQFPLPILPTKTPLTTYRNPKTGTPIDFYEVDIRPFRKRFFPNLQEADLAGYDGMFPGPLFRVERGRETVVRFINHGFRPTAMHLHGSHTRAPWDGWADDLILPGQYKDYYYPNKSPARTLWYHDHAQGLTTLNTYAGQVGIYIIRDTALERALGLPQGEKYDIPLLLDSHFFTPAGNISDESKERTSTYGDTFSVNGQIAPYLAVEPRKYRFRLLDASVSRAFNLSLVDGNAPAPFWVVGSDGGFRETPVETKSLVISMAERWEIVVDFASFAGKNLTLTHRAIFADTDYLGSDKVMQFRVGSIVTDPGNNGPLPARLVNVEFPTNTPKVERTFNFARNIGQPWTINGNPFSNPMNRILANPPLGTIEKYIFRGTGGWSHPVHLHLVDLQLLERRVGNPNQQPGRTYLEEYEKGAVKDVAVLGDNEAVTVLAKFIPYQGVYMFHCHNIVHEDFSMMAAFNITKLRNFGYENVTGGLEDPMDPRFRPRQYYSTDIKQIQKEVLPYYAALNAYVDLGLIEQKIEEYWSTQSLGYSAAPSPSKGSSKVSNKPNSGIVPSRTPYTGRTLSLSATESKGLSKRPSISSIARSTSMALPHSSSIV